MSSLFDRAGFSWPTREAAGQYELGTPFIATFPGAITALRWLRQSTSGDAPGAIRVWRASDQTVVATAASITDGGTVGWKDCPITGGWRPDLNVEYRVAVSNPASSGLGQQVSGATVAVPNGLAMAQSGRAYHVATPYVYPNSIEPGVWEAVDIVYEPDSPPPPPATTGDVDQALLDWLSSSSGINTHQSTGLPWLTKVDTALVLTELGTPAGQTVFGRLGDLITAAATAISLVTGLQTLLRPGGVGPSSAVIKSDGVTALDQHDDIISTLAAINALVTSLDLAVIPPGFPDEGWTLSDEGDFDDEVAVTAPADLYVVTFSTLPASLSPTVVAGVNWWPRLAWWAELDGTQLGQRGYMDFEANQLRAGRRLAGVLIKAKRGASGHWQAWTLG
jgi:hypothetical protein